jgi:hypothetical protein
MVVGAYGNCRSGWGRAMKKKNYSRDLMQLDEVRTFPSEMARTEEVAAARSQRTPAARNVESVES